MSSELKPWNEGCPDKCYGSEWFIAKLDNGDKVVLTALPEEFSYDYKTADETYYKADRIKYWMQFSDSQFIPFATAQHPAVEALKEVTEDLWSSGQNALARKCEKALALTSQNSTVPRTLAAATSEPSQGEDSTVIRQQEATPRVESSQEVVEVLGTMREALRELDALADFDTSEYHDALKILTLTSQPTVVEDNLLPDGYNASVVVYYPDDEGPVWYKATISKPDWKRWNPHCKESWLTFYEGKGPTPRAAVLDAISKIKALTSQTPAEKV